MLPIKDNTQPYMTRARYKSVPVREHHEVKGANAERQTVTTLRGIGQCDLEMRIYKRSLNATGLKPLLALHDGAWAHRGSDFIGFESEISHLTERDFVVFTPSTAWLTTMTVITSATSRTGAPSSAMPRMLCAG